MCNDIATVKKLLSKQTVDKLDAALEKGNMESLKKQMEKLFTFKNIFNMHDDHLIELAECLIDLSRAADRIECARAMSVYVRSRMYRYQDRKKKLQNENSWSKARKNADKVAKLDLKYRLWVYEAGFEYSRYHMYSMLCDIIQEILRGGDTKKHGAVKY